jgi:heme-degrading monooxygenase HmoA
VISAAFIFRPGSYDDEFHRLNKLIDAAARATERFLGSETWRSFDGKTLNATYYWETLEALKEFSGNADHLEAKKQYSRWYDGYHIVVSEVIRSYGDDSIPHLTPNDRAG